MKAKAYLELRQQAGSGWGPWRTWRRPVDQFSVFHDAVLRGLFDLEANDDRPHKITLHGPESKVQYRRLRK